MNSKKFFLAFTFFCTIPAYGMNQDNGTPLTCGLSPEHMGIKTPEEQQKLVLQQRLEDTYTKNSFIPFNYLDKKTDFGADILESIAQGTKNYESNTPMGQQVNKLDAFLNNHKENVKWCNSRLGKMWRFVTFKGMQKIDDKFQLSLVQQKLLWQLVQTRTGTPNTQTIGSTAANRLKDLESLIAKATEYHLSQIQGMLQTEDIVNYQWNNRESLILPNSATFPLIKKETDVGVIVAPEQDKPVVPSTQCWINQTNKTVKISHELKGHASEIQSCNPQQCDLSDQHFVSYEDDEKNGTKQLKVYALPPAPETRYEISQDGKEIQVKWQPESTIKSPCWTQKLDKECTTLALLQQNNQQLFAYSYIRDDSRNVKKSILKLQQLPKFSTPTEKSWLARFFALFNIFKANGQTPKPFEMEVNGIVKKIVPFDDNNFLCLCNNNILYNVIEDDKVFRMDPKKPFICLPTNVTDIAVDQHTNLMALLYYDNEKKQATITAFDKNKLGTMDRNYTELYNDQNTVKIKTISAQVPPKIQCYKGNIFMWHPAITLSAGADFNGERPIKIIPNQYSSIQSIKTSFAK